MPRYLLAALLLAALPCLAQETGFSREEIRTMHDFGVRMALEGERSPYVIPADLDPGRLVQAETVSFHGLDLQRLPPWLGRFTRLRHLDLSGTQVKAGQLAPLRGMSVLEHLDLTGVPLFAAGGGAADMDPLWGALRNLRILKLGGTKGTAGAYGTLGQLTNLTHLDLSGNGLSDLAPLGLASLQSLRTLNLSGSALGRLDPGLLPPNLSELDLGNSRLTAFTWRDGLDFPQLAQLKLGGNPGLTIDPGWGDVFLMQRLVALEVDSTVAVPKGWREKLIRPQLDAFKQAQPGRMAAIKAGCFAMGEKGQTHQVCVDAFKIGRHEVTFADYDLFCDATGRAKPADAGWGRDQRPAINIDWQDATAYADWVSQVTGGRYRLPTEAEWEYAARAGTGTDYWWGDAIGQNRANCDGCGSRWDNKQTAPVGSFPANPWGLHDTVGNVWEWTCSAYDATYGGGEKTCARKNDAAARVLRGGSWLSYARRARAPVPFRVRRRLPLPQPRRAARPGLLTFTLYDFFPFSLVPTLQRGNAARALRDRSGRWTRSARTCSHAGAWEPE
ncbi:SUMF1/EgtB/PvdO family nonheme iron enzyme [uncultured Thiodictyon sp.]|uniref:SUMF1/EgtB/PvdO family nonheme iron enzyme n=1 Tax=uncultured Thiodictyon sp. TaxID=1846217 RepID=UPI0025E9AFFE|nr:SUMF1/EgtB/PvdO family nonheme iron enzyme [uncultured Thiodictyon sp.]